MKTAKLFLIGKRDMINSFFMFLLSTLIGLIGDAVMQEINSGTYSLASIHWREIFAAVLVAVLSYLKKNFLSNSQGEILKKEPIDENPQ